MVKLNKEEQLKFIQDIIVKWENIVHIEPLAEYIISPEKYRKDGIPLWEHNPATPNQDNKPLPIDTGNWPSNITVIAGYKNAPKDE